MTSRDTLLVQPNASWALGVADGFGCDAYPAIREAELPDLSSLQDVFGRMITCCSRHCRRLGGFGGYKLGWKNNPLIAATLRLHAMYSPIFAGCFFPSGAEISLSHHKVFAAEAEYGFVMRHTLLPRDEAYTAEEVWAAVHWVEPAIEIIGARLASFSGANTSPYHLLADAMSNALVVRGAPISSFTSDYPPPEALTGGSWRVQLRVDNREVSSGTGSENPADSPLGSLTFLVNDLRTGDGARSLGRACLPAAHVSCLLVLRVASGRPHLPQAQVAASRRAGGAVEFGSHTVLEAYFEVRHRACDARRVSTRLEAPTCQRGSSSMSWSRVRVSRSVALSLCEQPVYKYRCAMEDALVCVVCAVCVTVSSGHV